MTLTHKIAYAMFMDLRSSYAHVVNVMHMCDAFNHTGQDVTLLVPGHQDSVDLDLLFDQHAIRDRFTVKFVPVPAIMIGRVNVGRNLFGMWIASYLLRNHIDLCFTRLPLVAWFNGHLGISCALDMHMPPTSKLDTWAFAQVVSHIKRGGGNPCKIVAISQRLSEIIHDRFDLPISSIHISHDAVDLEPYNKAAFEGYPVKRHLGIDDSTLLITYSGSLYQGRGVEMIVELAQRFPQGYFLVVGGDELRIKLCRQDFDRIKNLCFYGHVPHSEVARMLTGSDILLMPHARKVIVEGSYDIGEYTSPMKMFEYLAAAKPIVASNLPSILEILKNGENALIAEPEDIGSWSDCVSSLLANPGLRLKLGKAARATAEEHTWDKRAIEIMDFVSRP